MKPVTKARILKFKAFVSGTYSGEVVRAFNKELEGLSDPDSADLLGVLRRARESTPVARARERAMMMDVLRPCNS